MKSEFSAVSRDWAVLLFRPLVISGMAICVAASWVMLLRIFLGQWKGEDLVAIVGLVTFETLIVERQLRLRHLSFQEPRFFQIRLAELGIMVILVKVGGYLALGWNAAMSDIQRWIDMPLYFFDPNLILGTLVVGTMWLFAQLVAGNLIELEDVNNRSVEYELARQNLREQFLIGAIVLLIAVGVQRLSILEGRLALRPVQISELALLPVIYVALGLLLFGQVRYSLLNTQWVREQVTIAPDLERRWATWTTLFVVGVCGLVLLLPAGDTLLGFYLIMWLVVIVSFVGEVIFFLLGLILSIVLAPCRLLSGMPLSEEIRPPEIPSLPPSAAPLAMPDWLLFLRTAMFWIVAVLIFIFVIRTYYRDRRIAGIAGALWDLLCMGWQGLMRWLRGWADTVQQVFQREGHVHTPNTIAAAPSFWERWQARTARARVRRFYLMLLQRAAQAGHARPRHQTPYEFSTDLQSHLPAESESLSQLTEAFVQARYSRRDFAPEEISFLHRLWQRLQSAIKKLRGVA